MEPIEHFVQHNGDLIYLQEDTSTGAIKGVRLSDYDRIRIEKMGGRGEVNFYDNDFFEAFSRAFQIINT